MPIALPENQSSVPKPMLGSLQSLTHFQETQHPPLDSVGRCMDAGMCMHTCKETLLTLMEVVKKQAD